MTRPTRLMLVLHGAERAGTELHVLWLASGMRERGWSVSVAVSRPGPMLAELARHGLEVLHVPRTRGAGALYLARLAREARLRRVEVLHAHSGRLAAAAGRLARIPAVLETRHGLGPLDEPPDGAGLRRQARLCRLAHRTLVVSRVDRERLVAGGLAAGRVIYVPNGIPERTPSWTPGPPGKLRLGYLGRLSPEKNPLFLRDLAEELERSLPGRWSLTVAGRGPLGDRLAEALIPFGKAAFVAGEIADTTELFSRIDFLLVPSRREGQPISVLEAMQAGVIPLVADIPSLAELVGGSPAAGCALPLEPARWVAAMDGLLQQPEARVALAAEGSRRVRGEHGLDAMVAAIEQAYVDCFCASRR